MKLILLVVSCGIGGILTAQLKHRPAPSLAVISEAPFFVMIFKNCDPKCGGALIHVAHIITAAHCVVDDRLQKYSDLTVESGTNSFHQGGSCYEVEDVVAAPGYSSGNLTNDIAVITLSKRIRFEDFTALPVIGLPSAELKYGKPAKVIGFEDISIPVGSPLQEISAVIWSTYYCTMFETLQFLDLSTTFCAINDVAIKLFPNSGEGSPLVYDGNVIGIVSVESFGNDRALYYTNVRKFVPFIKSVIGESSKASSDNL